MREIVRENPLLAILRNVPLEQTVPYAASIRKGGVSFFEVAMNSPHAVRQIALLRREFGEDVLIGAGTVITVPLAEEALRAGAQFLLSPSADEEVLCYCEKKNIPLLPGALTPSEVTTCLRHGFDTIKLFPAGDMPRSYIKSLKGPLSQTEYVAIGGVTPENLEEFFRAGFLGVGLGSSILPREAAASGDWDTCAAYVAEMMRTIRKIQKR